jgi:hypothetical protein
MLKSFLSLNAYTLFEFPTIIYPTSSVFEISQQNQQLDSVGGRNAINPRDFVVCESCSTPHRLPMNTLYYLRRLNFDAWVQRH